jgi:hypothetical protein
MTSILKVLLLAMALVAGSGVLAVAGPYATHHRAPSQSLADWLSAREPPALGLVGRSSRALAATPRARGLPFFQLATRK